MSSLFDPAIPQHLLQACPAYEATPLQQHAWAGPNVWIKDETKRMGLGAFKALGGVYAVARQIALTVGEEPTPEGIASDAFREVAQGLTFVCASAGNHGMAVAAGARIFGAQCRIHLSATVPRDFEDRLRSQKANVVWSGSNYEESVTLAIQDAEQSGAIHLADGSWPGYTEPPRLVMEGYTVMALEMRDAFAAHGQWPARVYLQAGVGGLAAAIAQTIRDHWAEQPEITVVEPDAAPCLKESVAAAQLLTVEGPVSNMGRLDCKTPSLLAFDILSECADHFVTVTDAQASAAAKLAGTNGIPTTASGAAGLAACLDDATDAQTVVILSEGSVAS